eukprot:TRINITY_DN10515_c0_g1_i2.p2 TRINITY_DN10515_c0_g1~~TRINITY_DN10515_c0_g1_i2.p2  ORF type:complete len:319 (+),score=123.30 TRINITY_DN10515_c0_g1_i2:120-1076(+)
MDSAAMNVGSVEMVSQYAAPHAKLAVKQLVSKAEVAGDALSGMIPCAEACCEKENEYEIYGQDGTKILMAYEESGFCWRCCCNPNHPLKVHIHYTGAGADTQVMLMDRPFKCAGPCPTWGPCCQSEATLHVMPPGMPPGQKFCGEEQAAGIIENPQTLIGRVKQPICGGIFTPTVEVFQGNSETPFAAVEGPMCCFGGMTEMCLDQNFPVSRETGKAGDVGQITKEKPEGMGEALKELLSDADLFTLDYKDPSLTPQQKTALIAAVLLLDFMFFETNQAFECDPIAQECSIVCCYCYMCGALEPIKCSCGGGGGEGGE